MTTFGNFRPVAYRPENPTIPGLLTGNGSPAYGRIVEPTNSKGRALVVYHSACLRCGGAGGADKWAPTGWTCFDCGGSGEGGDRRMRVYTPEAYAKLEARRAKLAKLRADKAEAARLERLAPLNAWLEANAHLVAQIRAGLPPVLDEQSGERVHLYGSLAEKFETTIGRAQIPADWLVNACIEKIVRDGATADLRAASRHVGTVGKRIELSLTCERLLSYAAEWPRTTFYVAIMLDCEGNRIVYKGGNPPLGEGESGRFRATVKEHGERNGELQTVIARPKNIDPAPVAVDQWGNEIGAGGRDAAIRRSQS